MKAVNYSFEASDTCSMRAALSTICWLVMNQNAQAHKTDFSILWVSAYGYEIKHTLLSKKQHMLCNHISMCLLN